MKNYSFFLKLKIIGLFALLIGCQSNKKRDQELVVYSENLVFKRGTLNEVDKKKWSHLDIITDSIPGISLDKAYRFIEGKTAKEVIVAVIDTGTETMRRDQYLYEF